MWWGHSGFGGLPTTTGIKTTESHVTRSHDPCGNPEDSQSAREFPSLSVVFSEKMSQTFCCSTHTFSCCHESRLPNTHPAKAQTPKCCTGLKGTSENQSALSKTLCLAQFRASPPLFAHRAQHLLEIEPSCKSSSSKSGDKQCQKWNHYRLWGCCVRENRVVGGMAFTWVCIFGVMVAILSKCLVSYWPSRATLLPACPTTYLLFYTQAIKSATKHCDPLQTSFLLLSVLVVFLFLSFPLSYLRVCFSGEEVELGGGTERKRQIQGGGRGLHLQLYD